ncbi:hypothetical protein BDP27DRAFT_1422811 [Rhodocollybia butyracea]|uniref:Uncharacterized protein n=1 Tax=Rhodocollybia butyracea TaxID=206335 RepID=A0A9P5PT71_9AGAR|nr:hypothetical protein BDP27DRAFT_1422811 [Rhodocollybia butyracea]
MTAHPLIPTHSPSSRIFQDANNFSMPGPNIFNNISASPPQPPDLTTYNCRPQTHTRPASSRWVESEVYARQMLPRGNGFPLWRPKLNNSSLPSIYQEEGVQIGDLGIITRAELSIISSTYATTPHLDSTVTDTQELPRGHWVPSHPSNVRLAGVIPYCPCTLVLIPDEVGGGLSFRSEASKGALLVLPEGGSKSIICNSISFRSMLRSKHILGYDKTRAWGVSTFEYAEEGSVAMDFVPKKPQERNFPEYWFPRCDSAVSSNGTDDQYGNKSGCVFLRGFKIAIRSSLFRINCEVTCISDLDVEGLLPKPAIAWSSVPGRLLSIFLRSNSSQEHEYSDRDHITSYKHGVYHPSDVINQLLLDNDDKLDVAITHDDDWASVTRDNEDMPQNDELIRRIRNFHVQSMQSGGITYGCYSTPPRPLTDQVSNNIPPFNPAPLTTATQVDCDPSSSNDAKCKNSSQKPDDLSFGEIDSQTEIHIGEVEMVDRTGCSGGVFNPSKSPRKRKYSDGSDYSMFNAEVHTEEGKNSVDAGRPWGSSSNEVPLSPPLPSQEKPGPSDSKRLSISRSPSPPPPLPRITHRSIDKEETPR